MSIVQGEGLLGWLDAAAIRAVEGGERFAAACYPFSAQLAHVGSFYDIDILERACEIKHALVHSRQDEIVGFEDGDPGAPCCLDAVVHRRPVASVLCVVHDREACILGEEALQDLGRSIIRGIIHANDLDVFERLVRNRAKRLFKCGRGVEHGYYHRNKRCNGCVCASQYREGARVIRALAYGLFLGSYAHKGLSVLFLPVARENGEEDSPDFRLHLFIIRPCSFVFVLARSFRLLDACA